MLPVLGGAVSGLSFCLHSQSARCLGVWDLGPSLWTLLVAWWWGKPDGGERISEFRFTLGSGRWGARLHQMRSPLEDCQGVGISGNQGWSEVRDPLWSGSGYGNKTWELWVLVQHNDKQASALYYYYFLLPYTVYRVFTPTQGLNLDCRNIVEAES